MTPRAAYRHFANREALVEEVASAAQGKLADLIEMHIDAVPDGDDAQRAIGVLQAVGTGYIEFALTEPGWFDVAFFALDDMARAEAVQSSGAGGRSPYGQLGDALDALVTLDVLAPQRRPGAELACWSAVHGFAVLATDGPLREMPRTEALHVGSLVALRTVEGIIGQALPVPD